jgi:hypothetical protein
MTEATRSLIKTPDLDLDAAMRDPFAIVPQVLDLVRLNGAIFFRSHFRSPWAYTSPPVLELAGALPPAPGSLVLFHIVAEGNCWIALGDGVKRHLSRGDVVVMPYADAYASGSEEEAEPISITSLLPPPPWTTFPQIDYGGDGENTRMVCGYLRGDAVLFDQPLGGPAADPLLDGLAAQLGLRAVAYDGVRHHRNRHPRRLHLGGGLQPCLQAAARQVARLLARVK